MGYFEAAILEVVEESILEHRTMKPAIVEMQAFAETLAKLINGGFRFTVINNPDTKTATVVSITKPDIIRSQFPDFYIYLNSHNQKCVEKVFDFGG